MELENAGGDHLEGVPSSGESGEDLRVELLLGLEEGTDDGQEGIGGGADDGFPCLRVELYAAAEAEAPVGDDLGGFLALDAGVGEGRVLRRLGGEEEGDGV
jgi:hypothetical protein